MSDTTTSTSGMQPAPSATPVFLSRKEVERRTTYNKTYIYAKIRAGDFPKPVTIGANRVAWVESEIDAWMRARIAERDAA